MKKLLHYSASALTALALLCFIGLGTPASAQVNVTNVVTLTDFDTAMPGWDYGYYYSWGWPPDPIGQYTNGTYLVTRNYTDPTIDPTNGPICLRYDFTNSAFYELVTTNSGAGYGTGFGGPLIWNFDNSQFIGITNLEDYIFEFDSRVEGLDPAQTTANCEMQFQWYASGTTIYQLNFAYNPGSNWTHYSYLLSDKTGTGGTPGSYSNWVYFIENYLITDLRFNVNTHMPHDQYGWDDYNAIFVDNIKLSAISGPPPVEPAKFATTIFEWNMDDKPLWYGYGGYNWSQNSFLPTFTYDIASPGAGVGGSNAWILTMDNSALAAPNTPQWSGGGTGGGGPANLSLFTSGDLKQYRITFDAKAAGLNPLKDPQETTCRMQLFLDSETPGVVTNNMRLDIDILAGTNWTTSTFTLNAAGLGFGSKAIFATNPVVTGVRIQNQIENSSSETDWGFDADNVLAVDNIKLERIFTNSAPIWIRNLGTDVEVTWPTALSGGTMNLQSASSPSGPWNNIAPAPTSPYVTPIGTDPLFFRTKWTSP